ncbi:MAG: tetratricopeptide repeat protein [Elusimicrobia bacterium]|nr:tetratricopeptide repeat protein [Elusimicrobiota bacterium]
MIRPAAWNLVFLLIAAGLTVLVLTWRLGDWTADYNGWTCRPGDYHVSEGEALFHGLADPAVALSMPGFSIPNALLCNHATAAGQMLARGLSLLSGALLVFALGSLLHSGLCGAVAALLFALGPARDLSSDRWLYVLHVLLVAGMVVWRAQAPSLRRSLALGAAIGMSLLVLSPLFLFPLVLVGYEWLRRGRRPDAQAAAIVLVPLAALLPWVLMNWRIHQRLVLFEDGRAAPLIVAGALGYVSTGLTNWDAVLDGVAPGGHLLLWALRQVCGHPFAYAAACAQRLLYVVSFHPLLYAGALASAWLGRKREEHRQLALLAGTFIAIHCVGAVEERYGEPVLPLLCALCAAGALSWLKAEAGRLSGRLATGFVCGFAALLLAGHVLVARRVLAYPGLAARDAALDRELARRPADPWLWFARGRQRLAEQRPSEAAADLGRSLALAPRPEWRMPYAWARVLPAGPRRAVWERMPPTTFDTPAGLRHYAFRVRHGLQSGRRREAKEDLDLMRDIWTGLPVFHKESESALVRPRQDAWFQRDRRWFNDVLSCWPAREHPALLGGLDDLMAAEPARGAALAELWLSEAARAQRGGQREAALAALSKAQRGDLEAPQFQQLSLLYERLGQEGRSLEVLERGHALHPGDGKLWRALLAWRLRRLQGISDSGLLLDLADAAAQTGEQSAAMSFVARARERNPGARELGRIAMVLQQLGRHRQALEVLDGLARAYPGQARWLSDRGVLKMLMGDRRAAADDLARAVELDPGYLPACLSLGALYASSGRRQDAIRLYERSLARPVAAGDAEARSLREKVRSELTALRR